MTKPLNFLEFLDKPVEEVILRDDFKKSVAFNKSNSIQYLTTDSTIKKLIKMLFIENSLKNNKSSEPIERFIDVFSFTSQIAKDFSKSQEIYNFVNKYLDSEYVNKQYCNNILEKIVNKMLDVNDSEFVTNAQKFCSNLYRYVHIYPLGNIFINLTCYHSEVFQLTKDMVNYFLERTLNVNTSYDAFAFLTKLVNNKNIDKRVFKESEQYFDYSRIIEMITDESTLRILKFTALDYLKNVFRESGFSDEYKTKLLNYNYELGNNHPRIREAILELFDVLPNDYYSILFDKSTTTLTKYVFTKLNNIHNNNLSDFENLVTNDDLVGRLQNRYDNYQVESVETNPFPVKLGDLIFKINKFGDDARFAKLKDFTKDRLELKEESKKKSFKNISASFLLPIKYNIARPFKKSSDKAIKISGLTTFANQKNTWVAE